MSKLHEAEQTVSNKDAVFLHIRKRSPPWLREIMTECTKPVSTFNVCAQTGSVFCRRMFDYMWATGNHPYHTHIYKFAFINIFSYAEMGKKTSYRWLLPSNFINGWMKAIWIRLWWSSPVRIWAPEYQCIKQDKDLVSAWIAVIQHTEKPGPAKPTAWKPVYLPNQMALCCFSISYTLLLQHQHETKLKLGAGW